MLYPDTRLLVFAKAPVEGRVKTRLIPSIGSVNAAHLQRLMIAHVVELSVMADLCPVELWCYPDSSHEFFQELALRLPVSLYVQQGEDLGKKMFHAASHALQRASGVVIIGSDCLQFTPQHLQQAMESIKGQDRRVVLTPAQDGGYVLIGMNQVNRDLFENIEWGSARVLSQTRQALQQLGWPWEELPCLRDIDIAEDLRDIADYTPQYPLSPELNLLINKILASS